MTHTHDLIKQRAFKLMATAYISRIKISGPVLRLFKINQKDQY